MPEWTPDLLYRLRDTPQLLAAIAERANTPELALQRTLRAEFPVDLVPAAITLSELRTRAEEKFSRAATMWFDRVGLQQATAEAVARHKAARFGGNSPTDIADLCCGIGADAIVLAEFAVVRAVDSNPGRCLMTEWNAEAYGVESRLSVVCAEAESVKDLPPLVHIDPDRRPAGRQRSVRVEDIAPDLEFLHELMRRCDGGAIKLSPAANFAGNFQDCEFELVSLQGECKECTVWFGSLLPADDLPVTVGNTRWRATVLPSGESLTGDPLSASPQVGGLQRFLYDPDPAVVRAGLIDLLADRFGLSRLDSEEEYLTGDAFIESPFLTGFAVIAELPNNEREIRRYFRSADFQQVEIKCRRIPVRVEEVRRKLPLTGTQPAVLFFARLNGKARAIVARRM